MTVQAERRDRELQRSSGRPLPPAFNLKVVGVSFTEHYPANLLALQPLGNVEACLVRAPNNDHDPNAIEVHVPALDELGMIGHLTRPVAARLAPELDKGIRWSARVTDVLIDPDHPDRPGISVRCERVT